MDSLIRIFSGWGQVVAFTAGFGLLERLVVPSARRVSAGFAKGVATNLSVGFFAYLTANLVWSNAVRLPSLAGATAAITGPTWGALPSPIALLVGMAFLDLPIYVVHRLFHTVPVLWRFHRVHHMFELSPGTATFHHPLALFGEQLLIAFVQSSLGIGEASTHAWLSIHVYFNQYVQHTRLRLPDPAERVLGWVFVLPRHHAIHHSSLMRQTNSNYSFLFNVWDRLFGTFCPDEPEPGFRTGLEEFAAPEQQTVYAILTSPFVRG